MIEFVLPVAAHLSLAELRRMERTVPAADRVRVLAVRLMAEGRPATEVGALVGFSPEWVRRLVHRDNADVPAALGDCRRHNRGAAPLLEVAWWMRPELGREVTPGASESGCIDWASPRSVRVLARPGQMRLRTMRGERGAPRATYCDHRAVSGRKGRALDRGRAPPGTAAGPPAHLEPVRHLVGLGDGYDRPHPQALPDRRQ